MPWLPGLAAMLAAKYTVVNAPAGLGRVIGRHHLGSSIFSASSLFDRPALFQADLLLAVVLVPVMVYLALRWVRPRVVVSVLCIAGLASIAAFLPELLAYRFVGRFLSLDFVSDSIHRGLGNYQDFRAYVGFVRVALFLMTLLSIPALAATALYRVRRSTPRGAWAVDAFNTGVWGCLGLLTAVSLTGTVPGRPYSQPVAAMVWDALAAPAAVSASASRFRNLSDAQLDSAFRTLTNTPPGLTAADAFAARGAGYDVVFFVLETCFARCLDLAGPLDEFPSLKRMRDRSIVAPRHLSTFPYTNRAMFSLLASQYAPEQLNHLFLSAETKVDSIVSALSTNGYHTGLYMPEAELFYYEKQMYRAMGFQTVVRAANVRQNNAAWTWEAVTGRDRKAFDALRNDIAAMAAKNQRYFSVFLPQVGHEPWVRQPGQKPATPLEDCRAVVRLQDQLLGELLSTIEQTGRAGKTLIVVTGDHGARKRENFPDYQTSVLEYQFHVPFLLYAPEVLNRTQTIPWVTSHVDVAPSVLDLLGIPANRQFEQGSPLWDERIKQRTTLMLANAMFGFDAFHRDGKFYFWNRTLHYFHQADDLSAGGQREVAASDPIAAETERVITDAVDLQSLRLQRGNVPFTGKAAGQ